MCGGSCCVLPYEIAMRLLICEDDPLIALDLAEEAERRAASTLVVTNAADALRAIEAFEFTAAIVDLHLTDGRTGPDIARRLADGVHAAQCSE